MAGGRTLTAVLTGADGFFQARVHEGLRITVAGAGPQGAPLVSDVSEMRSGTTLELADAAAVTGASRAAARAVPGVSAGRRPAHLEVALLFFDTTSTHS